MQADSLISTNIHKRSSNLIMSSIQISIESNRIVVLPVTFHFSPLQLRCHNFIYNLSLQANSSQGNGRGGPIP